jgi:hypothetical protein
VWLIDFFRTGWGPILRDFGELETVMRFELLDTDNLRALYDFERSVLEPGRFDQEPLFHNRFHIRELEKLLRVLSGLRQLAQGIYQWDDMYEYYVGLLYYALKMVTWKGISSADRERFEIRQRHALLTAALIAYRLQHWDKWNGWPVS